MDIGDLLDLATQIPTFLDGITLPGLVSVVVPTWNRAYILPRAIESVLGQTHSYVEVVVVDDGSTDETESVVKRYDDRVKYIKRPNGGAAAARNTGLAAVRGEFVALLDSDDEWLPWKLEAQLAVFARLPRVGMVWTDMTAVDDHGQVISERYLRHFYSAYDRVHLESVLADAGPLSAFDASAPAMAAPAHVYAGTLFPQILQGNLVHTSTVVLRRDRLRMVGGFDESLQGSGEDYDFHLRTCSMGPVALLDASTLLYRIGADDQLTAPRWLRAMAMNDLRTVQRWLGPSGSNGPLPPAEGRARLSRSQEWVGEQCFACGNLDEAKTHLWSSWRIRPALDRRLVLLVACALPAPVLRYIRGLWWRLRHGAPVPG